MCGIWRSITARPRRWPGRGCGYGSVRGILQSANGELVPAYLSYLRDGQTYTISHSDAMKEYVSNPAFRAVLDSGRYIYCEGHFCVNDARYIRVDH